MKWNVSSRCPACGNEVKWNLNGLAIPETHVPGLEHDGEPMRLIFYHPECAPDFVKAYHEWLARN